MNPACEQPCAPSPCNVIHIRRPSWKTSGHPRNKAVTPTWGRQRQFWRKSKVKTNFTASVSLSFLYWRVLPFRWVKKLSSMHTIFWKRVMWGRIFTVSISFIVYRIVSLPSSLQVIIFVSHYCLYILKTFWARKDSIFSSPKPERVFLADHPFYLYFSSRFQL
jgi:hypothetical protein